MKGLVAALILIVPLVLAYAVGIRVGKGLGRGDRKALSLYRHQQVDIARVADEHAMLGDACAFKVQDILEVTRKELEK